MRSLERLSILFVMPPSKTASQAVFIQERGLAGFTQFGKKKCRIKFTLPGQIGRKKDPSIKYYFLEIKYSKTSLTITLI